MTVGGAAGEQTAGPRRSLVYHGGRLVAPDEAVLPVASLALRYAISVFEGIRLYLGADGVLRPWLLEQHLQRLRASCSTMGMDAACCDEIPAAIELLVEANGLREDCYVRAAISAANVGGIDEAAEPLLTVSIAPSGRKRWLARGEGIRLQVSAWQRASSDVFPSGAKNISAYAGPRLALTEAKAAGYDSCLLLTGGGLVSEAPTATVFLVEGETLATPRLSDSVLAGVTRAWVRAAAGAMGIEAVTAPVAPARLRAADEVFLCGTGIEFGPVREVDGAALGGWPRSPLTERLVQAYFAEARGEVAATAVDWHPDDAPPARSAAGGCSEAA